MTDTTDSPALLSCPFCGGEADVHYPREFIGCVAAECAAPKVHYDATVEGDGERAAAAWNRRADLAPAVRVKPLTEDDLEAIENDAHAEWRKVERERGSVRPATVTHLDSEAWWIMRATERRILAALEPTPAPAPAPGVEGLVAAARAVVQMIEGLDGYGTKPSDMDGQRLKDQPIWVEFYNLVAAYEGEKRDG